jgi:hypothetical protein
MKYALVNTTIASIKKEPKETSELIDEALYGMKVELIEEVTKEWYFIKTHYHYKGYVHKSELFVCEDGTGFWDNALKKVVVHSYIDVLTLPKVQGYRMISLTKGAVVMVLDVPDVNGWVKISLWDGRMGYVKSKFLGDYMVSSNPNKAEELRLDIVKTALSYYGTQYRWGGKSPLGIDCSGLCSMAYMIHGVIIFRDAKIEAGFPVHEIAYEEMKPADLLYFPGHIAMYIGKGKYIHATAKNGSDGVVINSLLPTDNDYRDDLPKSLKAVGSIF